MGRPKEFDRDEVLGRAMNAFWRSSYEATSVQDLVDEMGIGRASLYDTFGSKRQLFLDTLRSFIANAKSKLWEPLTNGCGPRAALQGYLDNLVEFYSNPENHSCMVYKTAVMPQSNDPEVRAMLQGFETELAQHLERHLLLGAERGEFSFAADQVQEVLAHLINGLRGLAVTACTAPGSGVLAGIARRHLEQL